MSIHTLSPLMLPSSVSGWYVLEDMVSQSTQLYGRRTST